MISQRIIASVTLSLAVLLAAVVLGCGGSTSTALAPGFGPSTTVTTTTLASPTTSPTIAPTPAEKQSAKAYFASMSSVIDKDYQLTQWFDDAFARWDETYGNTNLPANKQAWNALASAIEQALPRAEEISREYEAITPPDAFRSAHDMLLKNNRDGNAWASNLVAAIRANRSPDELMSMMDNGPDGPTDNQVLAEFQRAATRLGVDLPPKLIGAYSDNAVASQS
jgi:hypothetical protein